MTKEENGEDEVGTVEEVAALDLRQRTMLLARRIVRLYVSVPTENTVAQVVGKQVLRSGTSVGANYREADRARSTPEFRAKIGDCLKELDETSYWLELMIAEQIATPESVKVILSEVQELIAIFYTILKKTKPAITT